MVMDTSALDAAIRALKNGQRAVAAGEIRQFSQQSACSWCEQKGRDLAFLVESGVDSAELVAMAQELRDVGPLAQQMHGKIDKLRQISAMKQSVKSGGVGLPEDSPPPVQPRGPPRVWRDRPQPTRLYGPDRRDGRGRPLIPRRGGRRFGRRR